MAAGLVGRYLTPVVRRTLILRFVNVDAVADMFAGCNVQTVGPTTLDRT
jgi:hypothetical protein